MKIASRVFKTRDSIGTQVLETRVKCFVFTLPGQNCQVEPRGYRVYKTRDILNASFQNLNVQTQSLTRTLSLRPLKLTHSHSLTDSFIKQIRGPNLKQFAATVTKVVSQAIRAHSQRRS